MIEDALLIHEVARREHPDCQIVMYGHSMGTGNYLASTMITKVPSLPAS